MAARVKMLRGTATPDVGGGGASVLTKGYSFKDLDRMILEAPPVDEFEMAVD
ncbi:hypothetical protein F3Y22_tig00117005pilonHSYRG00054 [Hibiscus syriacus]|uniref:Uncharacterized protein n=1 Tax=Hibiscus syriacus TaxID=106335 RepID=A0A6A2WF90_HIBSY|nr:hypothetical protein F3Y22_tig00117005pilonHSYRG00054 [Hibiscus syriacus]